jgi:hypothetical protein
MKQHGEHPFSAFTLARSLVVVCVSFVSVATALFAQSPPGPTGGDTNNYYGTPISGWRFHDTNTWYSDFGYAPVSFSGIFGSPLGDTNALVVDSASPAWLRFNYIESDGHTNFSAGPAGSAMFWFAPTSWSSTNAGGVGPGAVANLLMLGSTNGIGRWQLAVDPSGTNLFLLAQTNGGPAVVYLSAAVSLTTNLWHQIAATYSTNTALYLDGSLLATGPAITNFPGSNVLANGFFIGSDNAGNNQAHGMFADVTTYSYAIGANTVGIEYMTGQLTLLLNPLNRANWSQSAPSAPSSNPYYNVITGAGYMQYLGASANCVAGSGVWLTNVCATAASQPMTFQFDIAGGASGLIYDVFATPALASPLTNGFWSWMGQGGTCSRYSIPSLPTRGAALFILGLPVDSDGDGLTDSYEMLVSHSDPNKADTDGNGMPDGWQVLNFQKIGNNPNSDPDRDGLTNLKEYLYGTNPNASEGTSIWVAIP